MGGLLPYSTTHFSTKVGKLVIGAKPRAASIFRLPPTRASRIRLGHATARQSLRSVARRAGSPAAGAAGRGVGSEAGGGGAARRDRPAEGSEGPPLDQAERHGERHRAEARRQAGQAPRPRQGDAAGQARDRGAAGGAAAGFAVQGLRAIPGAGPRPSPGQVLVITARVVRYRRERWLTPAGETIVAPLPGGIRGHFGPELRRFVLMQYHQGQSLPRRRPG